MNKICPICEIEFSTRYKNKIFCNPRCSAKHRAKKSVAEYVCDYCGKTHIKNIHDAKKFPANFCSKSCSKKYYWEANNGHHKIIDNVKNKYCHKCSQWLKLSNFGKDKNTWDSLISSCKECRKKYVKGYNKTPSAQFHIRAGKRRRYSREKKAGTLTTTMVKQVYDKNVKDYDGLTCVYCLESCENDWHLEHKIPLCRGGLNVRDNLTIACPACNLSKARKTDEEFIKTTDQVQQ